MESGWLQIFSMHVSTSLQRELSDIVARFVGTVVVVLWRRVEFHPKRADGLCVKREKDKPTCCWDGVTQTVRSCRRGRFLLDISLNHPFDWSSKMKSSCFVSVRSSGGATQQSLGCFENRE